MATKAELQSLLESVEAATGLDIWIDLEFLHLWHPDHDALKHWPEGEYKTDLRRGTPNHVFAAWKEVGFSTSAPFPAFTASIDAALALVERVLPGKHCRLGIGYVGDYSSADLGKEGRLSRWSCDGFAERPDNELPLAILAALLRALIAQADADLPPR